MKVIAKVGNVAHDGRVIKRAKREGAGRNLWEALPTNHEAVPIET
jgi:hypothetical protein